MRISLVLALLFTLVVFGGISFRGGASWTYGDYGIPVLVGGAWGHDVFLGVHYQHELSGLFSIESGIDYGRRREAFSYDGEVYQTDFRYEFLEFPVLGVLRYGLMELAIGGAYATCIDDVLGNRSDWGATARIGVSYWSIGAFVEAYKWFNEVPGYLEWTIIRVGAAYCL